MTKEKINKSTGALNHIVNQVDATDISSSPYPVAAYTGFSIAHGTFSRIGHFSGCK